MRIFFGLILFIVAGCSESTTSRVQVVAALDKDQKEFGLKVVEFSQPFGVVNLTSDRIRFVSGLDIPQEDYIQIFEKSENFQHARRLLFEKIVPNQIYLNLVDTGEYVAALDFDSLYLLTAYYLLDSIKNFFEEASGEKNEISDPLVVGVYGAFTTSGALRIPSAFVDNSSYLPLVDIFKIYRVGDQRGLPYSMNPGVVAHEVHHQIFHKKVFEAHGADGFKNWKSLNAPQESLTPIRSQILIRSLDEGLADLFGVGFSGNLQFLSLSTQSRDPSFDKTIRDLDGDFARTATYENLGDGSISPRYLRYCGGNSLNYSNPKFRYYCLGTVIASTIWKASGKSMEILKRKYIPHLGEALKSFGKEIIKVDRIDLDLFWNALLQELDESNAQSLCRELKSYFSSILSRVKKCDVF